MRLHQPVALHEQPHLKSFFQGGIPADGRTSPKSIAVSSGSYDDGGTVDPYTLTDTSTARDDFEYGGKGETTPAKWDDDTKLVTPTYSVDKDKDTTDSTDTSTKTTTTSKPLTTSLPTTTGTTTDTGTDTTTKTYDDGGVVSPNNFVQWPNQVPQQGYARGGEVPSGSGADDGGFGLPDQAIKGVGWSGGNASTSQRGRPARDDDVPMEGEQQDASHPRFTLSGHHYAGGGTVKKPHHRAVPELVAHSKKVHAHVKQRVEQAWHAEKAQAQRPPAPPPREGIPMPPGPAGPGVRPQPAIGNAGRPGFVAPNPVATSQEKNYAQNVTSRPATSPSVGTAYMQPGPDGGQRGQEWYGKGASPYGAGRMRQNG